MEGKLLVRLRDFGSLCACPACELELKEGDIVIVEHDRGLDYGQIFFPKENTSVSSLRESVKKVVRLATSDDIAKIEEARKKAKEAFIQCEKEIQKHKLDMKLVHAEYSFDRSKILFYFTAEERVDFRGLVKDLAKIFKARIELRWIGVRDEARLFGGFGPCGRELCCAKFLNDFEPVTIKMAKEEGLPLNPPKISGLCGRLMCCLNFEYETYKILSRGLPKEGERIHTPQGKAKVVSVNVFTRIVTVELEDGTQLNLNYKEKGHAE